MREFKCTLPVISDPGALQKLLIDLFVRVSAKERTLNGALSMVQHHVLQFSTIKNVSILLKSIQLKTGEPLCGVNGKQILITAVLVERRGPSRRSRTNALLAPECSIYHTLSLLSEPLISH